MHSTWSDAPGSRSSPLAIAASTHPATSCIACIDERSLAFHAVGYARSSHKPAVIITSSGTAVSNLHPATVDDWELLPLLIWSIHSSGTLWRTLRNNDHRVSNFAHQLVSRCVCCYRYATDSVNDICCACYFAKTIWRSISMLNTMMDATNLGDFYNWLREFKTDAHICVIQTTTKGLLLGRKKGIPTICVVFFLLLLLIRSFSQL
uniref:Thiamine pyrophosphate enzyme N-terminal TPP-binding domain-containing protein n=1 Tax=Nicotiana tabacum TaxID=4097 RepID=A0A1S3Z5J9_TOBAC|nr:PREDICTED: uncharacterized protein LOC107783289 [Nicotiana tabacum]